jgi:hypothetical protein
MACVFISASFGEITRLVKHSMCTVYLFILLTIVYIYGVNEMSITRNDQVRLISIHHPLKNCFFVVRTFTINSSSILSCLVQQYH